MTYSEAANLALNQTLVRSINTSIVALLPVAAILFVGVGLLGAGTLKDLALALFIGTAAGTYSSIFIATPVACQLQERRPGHEGARGPRRGSVAPVATASRAGRARARPAAATATAVLDEAEAEAPPSVAEQAKAAVRRAPTGQRQQPKKNQRRAASARRSDVRARRRCSTSASAPSPTGRCPA